MVSTVADVAELADALGLGPSARKGVGVRLPPSALLFTKNREHSVSASPIGPHC